MSGSIKIGGSVTVDTIGQLKLGNSNVLSAYIGSDQVFPDTSPQLIFDFSQTSSYSNSGTSITDLSGKGNNGIFTQGTGNGTPTTVTGYSTNGYLNLEGTVAELSVRLPDTLKPTGVVPFTYIVYMQPNGYGYLPNYPGIIASQYYNGVYGEGFSWYLTPNISPNGQYTDRDQFNAGNLAYSGGAGLGTWSVYGIKFDGTTTKLYQYYNGTLYTSTPVINTQPITSYSSWVMYLGLRYNNWLNAKFNYVAMYKVALVDSQIETIANTLSQRVIV